MPARVLIACLLAIWVGCSRQPASSASLSERKTESAAPDPADLPAAETTKDSLAEAPDDAQMAAILGELTQVVRKFSVERRNVPKNLQELVTNGYLTRAPQAPSGKQFIITKDLRVQLVNK